MSFNRDKPIFQQIVEKVEDAILSGALQAEARIPAVRDYALMLEVNPNTVVRSFAELEQAGSIFKKRGLGYFVAAEAKATILARRRREFLADNLPVVVATMKQLGLGPEVLVNLFNEEKDKRDETK
jgi:DNA-binding transcriptional regulator YhcF (GntR family)